MERANEGYSGLRFDEKIDYDVRAELEKLGYTIKSFGGDDPREPNEKRYWVVSWR